MNFYKKVYNIVKQIPKGKVTTYGQIAKMIGKSQMFKLFEKTLDKIHLYIYNYKR